jgi:hypothetical protein
VEENSVKGRYKMKILDENGKELATYDAEKGYLTSETIVIAHHDAVEAKAGKSHVEVVKEYDNGGKDVITVWDEKPTEAKEAWDETEEIQKYILYTVDELKAIADAKAEAERLAALPSTEERLKATEDAIMAMVLGGTSNV